MTKDDTVCDECDDESSTCDLMKSFMHYGKGDNDRGVVTLSDCNNGSS